MQNENGYRETIARLSERFNGAELISIPEAANVLGISEKTFRSADLFPIIKIGKQYRIALNSIAIFLTRKRDRNGN